MGAKCLAIGVISISDVDEHRARAAGNLECPSTWLASRIGSKWAFLTAFVESWEPYIDHQT